jgi:hypothetical protein
MAMHPLTFPRTFLFFGAVALALLVGGCATQPANESAHLATFTTRLAGTNVVPATASTATGTADAVLDKQTRLLRWKMSFSQLSGPVTMAHFHGPAAIGANAGVALDFAGPVKSPYEGRATLSAQQAADLLAGKWYINLHTARYPGGEVRGQMIERK